jgi:thioredoxin 1
MSRIHLLLSGLALVSFIGCGQNTAVTEDGETVEATETASHTEASASEFKASISGGGLVLAKFGAPWCGPCVKVDSELDVLEENNGDQLTVVRINVDEEPELAEELEISAIPVLLLYKDGQRIEEWLGFEEADVFQASIDQALAQSTPVGDVRENDFIESE